MSRTDAHVPEHVELDRTTSLTALAIKHRHWVPGRGIVACLDPDAGCQAFVRDWASTQPYTRHGSARIENRARIRDALRKAVTRHRAGDDLEDLDVPCPEIWCLCWMCGW